MTTIKKRRRRIPAAQRAILWALYSHLEGWQIVKTQKDVHYTDRISHDRFYRLWMEMLDEIRPE